MKFGKLTVIEYAGSNSEGKSLFRCLCDCGNETTVLGKLLRNGTTKSCGCLIGDVLRKRNKRHGCAQRGSTERLYKVWLTIRNRLYNPKSNVYQHYGGRGIRMCDEWNDYQKFREWAYENGYDPNAARGKCTIDRIDPDGDYTPDNCRWVDMYVQSKNKRRRESSDSESAGDRFKR